MTGVQRLRMLALLATAALMAAAAIGASATEPPGAAQAHPAAIQAPAVCLSGGSFNFGTISLGTTSTPQTLLVTNCGTVDNLTITSVTLTGTNPGDFALPTDACTGASLVPTTSCKLTMTFTPTAIDGRSATVSILDNAPGSPHQVFLFGTGASPRVCLSTGGLNFGNVVLAATSAPQTVAVTNCGSDVLTFTSITLTGTNPGDFGLTDNCSAAPLAPTTSCTLVVTFTPTAIDGRSATVSILDDAPGSPHQVGLFGIGASPRVCLNTGGLNFGIVVPAATSAPQTVAVANCGSDVLTFTSITLTGTNPGDFGLTDNCSAAPLDPTTSCTLVLTFTPTAIDGRSATLSILDNAPGSPHLVGLSGTGATPRLCFSPGGINFGPRAVGTTSPPQTVLVTNCGSHQLNITTVALTGTNPGDFALANDSCTASSLAVQQSCSVDVTFTPTTTGSRSASLTVTSNAPGSPHNLSLFGIGT